MGMATEKTKAKAIERLFDDFFNTAQSSFESLEHRYGIGGVMEQLFGKDPTDEEAREKLRNSWAWQTLVAAYEYAVNGIEPDPRFDGPSSLVIDASDVLKLANSENYRVSEEWDAIIAMGDGRFGLDEGNPVLLYKVALLANVDIRTVRNATSSGELVTFKNESDSHVYVENSSARRWLHGRRGFKPTVVSDMTLGMTPERVSTPAEFGAMLVAQRERNAQDNADAGIAVAHPAVSKEALAQLEAGVFSLPLDAVFPVADFYLLDRKKFLQCVMRVFFGEELQMLADAKAGQNN
jgi:hypothetical protein